MAKRRTKLPPLMDIARPGYHRDRGDGAAVGLYLEVRRSRSSRDALNRSWLYRFVSPVTGRPRWMGLGSAGAIGLADAREIARAARREVVLGNDPIEARQRARDEARAAAKRITFAKCATRCLRNRIQAKWFVETAMPSQ